ncbi:MAG: 30S ribosomal protein S2, partial [Ignavibacteriae bacterium]|nr:30S ribosomal protein S2 [Ignavibacteriota bacterium]
RAIELITKTMVDSVIEGLQKYNEVKAEKAAEKEKVKKQEETESEDKKTGKPKIRKVKFNDKGERKDVVGKKNKEAADNKEPEAENKDEVKEENKEVEKKEDK